MNIFAFLLLVVAAVIFLLVPDGDAARPYYFRSSVRLGLFFLTVGLMVQFIFTHHTIHSP